MIKLVVFDFDGVFTNGINFFDNKNNILKSYNIKDGKGLSLLKNKNIKIGLISNFNTDKQILYNNKSWNNLLEHLRFDKVFIGEGNKLNILNKWLDEYNLDYSQVAFIGDDLNDLSIIEKVKLSACPNDAIDTIKEKVNYICKKKGGEGCVREFIDLILNYKQDIIQEIRKELNYQLDNLNLNHINNLVNLIKNTDNNIYFMGIGKSGNIAKHCSDLLKSISINCYYLNSINLLHGDIGTLNQNLIVMFSKSGNTHEIIELIPFLKQRKCYVVGICCDDNSLFEKDCDLVIKTPFTKEIDGAINKIPTNSIMSHLLFTNILVSKLKENINIEEYSLNHPSGNIGKNLLKIKDCLILDFPKIILDKNVLLHKVFLNMTKYKIGCCFFVNYDNKLLGILTDGDIRRLLLTDENKKFINKNDINKNYFFETNIDKYVFEYKKYNYLPIIKNDKLIGIIYNT
ncbi:putative bifunctional KDO 8-phosphate phosphatase/arabinose 5-phosphate isomerase [Cafeteria roenbergensis virus]|uniref:Putative bifunctional KDO 8-phosphate phosphatase/arabinose 5-phosphate isomerase n=1 Tax=Cafeteria roenbergensis virus (strain BV-PW1) TaxID=693272 RepID=E3T535_CROVB|nr:arabinose 5-phosphate isomerase [Cafeteria roenbergensis virus BV-PW1]ADO67298.1 putative bifunctional KDO 8-phosphate phosphatase/arabinose 5-phosphate isomerase [Cafeteria roenbergensis virus BV-PW1]